VRDHRGNAVFFVAAMMKIKSHRLPFTTKDASVDALDGVYSTTKLFSVPPIAVNRIAQMLLVILSIVPS